MNQCHYPLPTALIISCDLGQARSGHYRGNWISPERHPHPKCLERTWVNLLGHMYGISDDPEKSRPFWLQGMAGVGKSTVAFTIAERNQRVSEWSRVSTSQPLRVARRRPRPVRPFQERLSYGKPNNNSHGQSVLAVVELSIWRKWSHQHEIAW